MLIGIIGRRGSGKSTVARLLKELDPSFVEHAFADALKHAATQLSGHRFDSQEDKRAYLADWGMTAGEFLQRFGAAVRNGVHTDAWVMALLGVLDDARNTVVSDVRYPNEADALRKRGGVLWKIEGDPLKQQGDGTRDDSHPSEVALDDYQGFDVVLQNTGTLDDLRANVAWALKTA